MGGSRAATRTEQHRATAKGRIIGVLMDATNTSGGDAVDGANENHVAMMIEDLERGLKRHLENIKIEMANCKQEQLQAHASGMLKIPKATREMTVQDFNAKYNCNLLEMLTSVRSGTASTTSFVSKEPATMCGKRDRLGLETPAPYRGRPMQTPGTVRTVRRGEMMFSKNGSPVDAADEGALVATVTKKRRGNDLNAAANFDINIGDGKYISLNDPGGVQHLDDDMKNSALTQLKVLQDQMASLMQQLTTSDQKK